MNWLRFYWQEWTAELKILRCMIAQGFMRGLILALLICAAGYGAFKAATSCPTEQCASQVKVKK